ncbi:dUTP diphosphatase [Clostridium sp. 'White wine YQ']|uniref:dUTP diphosphatase n=1 Tax=Clostridium sp. 'White wine YQ' TaxID=3027474 RepID=UPI002365682A|nr:aminotransferase [Clostridium sp. 'White wine YQ']MDD7792917.1 aminotransferase [Clostridium sp. 'White wine YQ']
MSEEINVYIKVNEEGAIPTYGSLHAAGCDLYASMDLVIRPGEVKIVPLNFSMAIPNNCEAQIRPRSGLSLKTNIRIPNSPGTIDADYRDVVGVIVENNYNNANLKYEILRNPEIIDELKENYVETSLSKYLKKGQELKILEDIIYLDKKGNPYGTIYIKKNERIAQMVFCEYKKAKFIEHDNPAAIGENRGGGFGHTGV